MESDSAGENSSIYIDDMACVFKASELGTASGSEVKIAIRLNPVTEAPKKLKSLGVRSSIF